MTSAKLVWMSWQMSDKMITQNSIFLMAVLRHEGGSNTTPAEDRSKRAAGMETGKT